MQKFYTEEIFFFFILQIFFNFFAIFFQFFCNYFANFLQFLCKKCAKKIAKKLQKNWKKIAKKLQKSCKKVAKNLQNVKKIFFLLCKIFAKFLQILNLHTDFRPREESVTRLMMVKSIYQVTHKGRNFFQQTAVMVDSECWTSIIIDTWLDNNGQTIFLAIVNMK